MVRFEMGCDSLAKKMPRCTSPASFRPSSWFARYLLVVAPFLLLVSEGLSSKTGDLATKLDTEFSLLQDMEPLGDLEMSEKSTSDGEFERELSVVDCVVDYDEDVDYFLGNKLRSVDLSGEDFSVTYHKSFKIITNELIGNVYIAYLCGTPPPDGLSGQFVQIPPKTYGMSSQTFLPLFQILGVADGLKMYTSQAPLPKCLVDNNKPETHPCDFFIPDCVDDFWESMDDPVDVLFADSFSTAKGPRNQGGRKFAVVKLSQEFSSSNSAVAGWLKYMSLFFNQERVAVQYGGNFDKEFGCFAAITSVENSFVEKQLITVAKVSPALQQSMDSFAEKVAGVSDPFMQKHLLETALSYVNFAENRASSNKNKKFLAYEDSLNVLILTGYEVPGFYYVGVCDNYYCEFAESSNENVRVIDADILDLDPELFFLTSQDQLVNEITTRGIQIDVVIMLYYLVEPTAVSQFPGPQEGDSTFFSDLLQELNVNRAFFIPETDPWFSYRPGVPHIVQADFLKMIQPELIASLTDPFIQGNSLYFFQEFDIALTEDDANEEVDENRGIVNLAKRSCSEGSFALPICDSEFVVTRNPTVFPVVGGIPPSPDDPNDDNDNEVDSAPSVHTGVFLCLVNFFAYCLISDPVFN